MSEDIVYLLYQKDFTESGGDRYFIYDGQVFSEVSSTELLAQSGTIITHDYWLIASSIYRQHQSLPESVLDVVLLSKIVHGTKQKKGDNQAWDIINTVKPLYSGKSGFDEYTNMYYRRTKLCKKAYMLFSHKLAEYLETLKKQAMERGEWDRFETLEMPIHNHLMKASCQGIRVDRDKVSAHKQNLKHDFYRELKNFAEKHNVFYQLPSEEEIREKLSKLGYNLEGYSLDSILDLFPSKVGYTNDLRSLQETNKSFRSFNSISSSKSRISPIPETHWTSTSRIYHKAPALQNISKKYRDIFIADDGKVLSYVDYDQFEIGVMAAITEDPKLLDIYQSDDAYADLAEEIFKDKSKRKKAKILFLAFTYGMTIENLMNSVQQLGGDVKLAKEYFSGFSNLEKWKQAVYQKFETEGRIETICGNFLNRENAGILTAKEKRSAVNHVVQGSATFIFKRAMLETSKIEGVQILIPMHDAVLFQHSLKVSPKVIVGLFEKIMTETLDNKVSGKASIEDFYVGEIVA